MRKINDPDSEFWFVCRSPAADTPRLGKSPIRFPSSETACISSLITFPLSAETEITVVIKMNRNKSFFNLNLESNG
jgi:hypothetical protein